MTKPEPVAFDVLLREADEIVRRKPTWRRYIDGTPLSNDIAVWMAVFAQDKVRDALYDVRRAALLEAVAACELEYAACWHASAMAEATEARRCADAIRALVEKGDA